MIFKELSEIKPEIGEPFQITEIFKILKEVQEVLDVVNIKVTSKTGTQHATFMYDIESNISPEGRIIYIPHNCVWELKYKSDITGNVR